MKKNFKLIFIILFLIFYPTGKNVIYAQSLSSRELIEHSQVNAFARLVDQFLMSENTQTEK